MKSLPFQMLTFLIFGLVLSACTEKNDSVTLNFTEEEAAEVVGNALTYGTGGLIYTTEELAAELVEALQLSEICDSTFTDQYDFDYNTGRYDAFYDVDLSYTLACNTLNIPTDAAVSSAMTGEYSAPKAKGITDAALSGSISGLQLAESAFVLAGTYDWGGSQEVSVREQKSVNAKLDLEVSGLRINKSTFDIESGEGTYSLNGTYEEEAFVYSGSFSFTGNGKVSLYVNGEVYIIELN